MAYALAPIESLVLGNFAENYSENKTDPLNYIFMRDKTSVGKPLSDKRELALYRGFYEEGKNLSNYCKENRPIRYATEWHKVQVMRSLLSEIQYIGLDMTSRALPKYARALEFTKEEYTHLVDNLVGNYCSSNLSVISKKELKNNMMLKFEKENNFRIPSIQGNSYFPDNLETYYPVKSGIENEFLYTVKLFQSVCSWSGNPNNSGLMVPLLKNPVLMAFFFRQMDNLVIDWREQDNTLFVKEDKKTVQVWCEHLICRKTQSLNFYNKIYYSVGGTNLSEDLRRLYCQEFETIDFLPHENDERLAKMMNSQTFDEAIFINSQFIALITGIPDFLLRADKFTRGEDILRSSVDYTWSKWAKGQSEILNSELYFEEPLTLELVDRKMYFKPKKPEFKVVFDVNLGEFDRINQRVGKVRVSFRLHLQKSFIHYYRDFLKNQDFKDKIENERVFKRFKLQMNRDVKEARDKFIIPPWKGDIENLMATELTEQLQLISDKDFTLEKSGVVEVEVELNYAPFALKYIHHQKNVQNNRRE
jgi:hypothetical protein